MLPDCHDKPPSLPKSDKENNYSKVSPTPTLCNENEGLWHEAIEKSFQEAILLFPPCGRQKIVIESHHKMYGRNELIAKHIFEKTGQKRSRKQVYVCVCYCLCFY